MAVAVTLFLLGGQALGTIHQLIVPHQLCAEHGHLIHAERQIVRVASHRAGGPEARSGTREGDEHAHCSIAVRRDELRSVVLPPNAVSVAPPPSAETTTASARLEPVPGLPLILLAPKQSPPV